jgi:hypothetical protein
VTQHMRRRCSLRRAMLASGSLAFVLATVLTSAGTAYAGAPFEDMVYQGPTAHGRYTVELTTSGSSGGEVAPAYVGIVLDTHRQPGTGCATMGYAFDSVKLEPDGSFSTTAYFSDASPQLTFTVKGTFVSVGTVRGTVAGNYGCGTDSFTIDLHPAPLISTSPCALLAHAHAVRTIGGGLSGSYDYDSSTFTPQGGDCVVYFDNEASVLSFEVASSPHEITVFQHHKSLPGLGRGATLYYNNSFGKAKIVHGKYVPGKPTTLVADFEVKFRRSNVWASLSRASHTGCECFSPTAFAVQERRVLALAHALRPLLH